MLYKYRVAVVCQAICLIFLIFFAAANVRFVSAQSFQPSRNLSSPEVIFSQVKNTLYVNNNVVYEVWSNFVGANQISSMRRSFDGGSTWQPKQTLGEGTATMVFSGNNAYAILETRTNIEFFRVNLRRSTDNGATFSDVQTLAEGVDGNRVTNVRGFAVGNAVFVTWSDGLIVGTGGPYYRRSNDGGATFDTVQTFPEKGDGLMFAAGGNYLYTVYGNRTSVVFRRSSDNGATFEPAKIFTVSSGGELRIAADQNNVNLLWTGSPTSDLFFTRSTDNGATFNTTKNVTNNTAFDYMPEMVASGQNIFIIYLEQPYVFYTRSANGGADFQTPVNLSPNDTSQNPHVRMYNSTVYMTWEQTGLLTNNYGVAYRVSNDFGANFFPRQTIYNTALNSSLALFNNIPLISAVSTDDAGDVGIIVRRSRPLPPRGFLLNKLLRK